MTQRRRRRRRRRFLDFVALSVLLNSQQHQRGRETATKSHTLYKAVNKMCISLNSLSERRLADGSQRCPALHIFQPIKMHFAKKFSFLFFLFKFCGSLNCSFVCLICGLR